MPEEEQEDVDDARKHERGAVLYTAGGILPEGTSGRSPRLRQHWALVREVDCVMERGHNLSGLAREGMGSWSG
jgi:hypothetical protein